MLQQQFFFRWLLFFPLHFCCLILENFAHEKKRKFNKFLQGIFCDFKYSCHAIPFFVLDVVVVNHQWCKLIDTFLFLLSLKQWKKFLMNNFFCKFFLFCFHWKSCVTGKRRTKILLLSTIRMYNLWKFSLFFFLFVARKKQQKSSFHFIYFHHVSCQFWMKVNVFCCFCCCCSRIKFFFWLLGCDWKYSGFKVFYFLAINNNFRIVQWERENQQQNEIPLWRLKMESKKKTTTGIGSILIIIDSSSKKKKFFYEIKRFIFFIVIVVINVFLSFFALLIACLPPKNTKKRIDIFDKPNWRTNDYKRVFLFLLRFSFCFAFHTMFDNRFFATCSRYQNHFHFRSILFKSSIYLIFIFGWLVCFFW